MNLSVYTFKPAHTSAVALEAMLHLRHEVFHRTLGWDVQAGGDLQRDFYDCLPEVVYIKRKDRSQMVDACRRVPPTTGPCMHKEIFPTPLHGQPAPRAVDVWELSRFEVATSRLANSNSAFFPISIELMKESANVDVVVALAIEAQNQALEAVAYGS